MAVKKKAIQSPPPIKDLTYWYSDLAFFDPEYKGKLWCAQALFYGKLAYVPFLDEKTAHEYRRLEKLELDEPTYRQMQDPKTPMGKGGTAEYFAADFKAHPFNIHLRNNLRARLNKIGIENDIQVNEIDKYAKSQKQKDKDRIIWQREFRNLINEVNQKIGLPPIKESQSPYNYVKSLKQDEGGNNPGDSVDTLLDYIRSQVRDSQDLVLYETYIYKGDLERAFELGIKHYLINLNKWNIISEQFNDDLVNFNKASGCWLIDETTGRGTVEYIDPTQLWTSTFHAYNGEDIVGWFYEKDITFANFVRQFGTTLTNEEIKEVFELNKYQGGSHGMAWNKADTYRGANAKIRIGRMSLLTQDAENFAVEDTKGLVKLYTPKKLSWLPDKNDEDTNAIQAKQKIYNVWYSFYYVPPPSSRYNNNAAIDWAWQSKFIFNLRKDIDMYRYGVDMRYAKSSLVIWKDSRASFTDVEQSFMPKIHSTWHRFQNCLLNDVDAVLLAEEFLGGILNTLDEVNKDGNLKAKGVEAQLNVMRQIKQGNMAFLKMTDKQGNVLLNDPSKLVIPIKNGQLERAEKCLKVIVDLYTQMVTCLGQNDLTQAKPRTTTAGIEQALTASQNSTWFIEKGVREFTIMFGERTVQHILCMIKERKKFNFKERFNEFAEVVGDANIWMLEGIEDLNPEEIGLTVSLEDTKANQEYVVTIANQMAKEDKVSYDAVGLVMSVVSVNWKYAWALLMVAVKQKERELSHKEDLAFQRQMQLEQEKTKQAMALVAGKAQGKNANIDEQGKIDMMVNDALNRAKSETMTTQKEQLKNNKLQQQAQKSELDKQEKTHDALSPEHK